VTRHSIQVNRAPVLTLWAAVVAERMGHTRETALTLGKAVAGLNAQSKGRRLHIFEAPETGKGKKRPAARPAAEVVLLLGRSVPVVKTQDGVRAREKDHPMDPDAVERYLAQKFGDALADVRSAMQALARAFPPARLDEVGFGLYEEFRPDIPEGRRGWGAKGTLNLDAIRALVKRG
jgi:hypothetical protein